MNHLINFGLSISPNRPWGRHDLNMTLKQNDTKTRHRLSKRKHAGSAGLYATMSAFSGVAFTRPTAGRVACGCMPHGL